MAVIFIYNRWVHLLFCIISSFIVYKAYIETSKKLSLLTGHFCFQKWSFCIIAKPLGENGVVIRFFFIFREKNIFVIPFLLIYLFFVEKNIFGV